VHRFRGWHPCHDLRRDLFEAFQGPCARAGADAQSGGSVASPRRTARGSGPRCQPESCIGRSSRQVAATFPSSAPSPLAILSMLSSFHRSTPLRSRGWEDYLVANHEQFSLGEPRVPSCRQKVRNRQGCGRPGCRSASYSMDHDRLVLTRSRSLVSPRRPSSWLGVGAPNKNGQHL